MRSHTASSAARGSGTSTARTRLAAAFFLFGTLNNIIYVVILSAALDLVDKASTPKGLILLVNIAPALLVKIGWPYFVPGPTRYTTRIVSCSLLSFVGILVVALSGSILPRLCGIALASFSSGLGEMTYLQRATLFSSVARGPNGEDLGGVAVGWFSSGTGAAGVGGAGLWWVVRGLGVRGGLGLCSFLPLCMALTYFLLLPRLSEFASQSPFSTRTSSATYSPLPRGESLFSDDDEDGVIAAATAENEVLAAQLERKLPSLTTREKLELARPLVRRYMLPLFFVYLAEYTINSGIAPTLLYKVPTREGAPILHLVIQSLRDYYPLWALLYQTFVFVSRSSLSILRLPPLPLALLPLPTLLQLGILFLTALESRTSFLVGLAGEHGATWLVALLVCAEGLCGGAAYVNAFHRLATEVEHDREEHEDGEGDGLIDDSKSKERRAQEKEFAIASVGFADTLGILSASLVSMALEPALCSAQVARGRTYCRDL
ncbi:amino acid transporter YHC3 [Rhodotorula paludigena]|uniref:amino acid transporter YHC3 n=1 Tax=Rhodotorula paludigena TaxID=86838 RepID=UPI0031702DF7